MFHTYVASVMDVAYVCNGFQVFLGVFANISNSCFKCFICLHMYVASVVSECFKSRSGCCIYCNVTHLLLQQLLEGARGVGRTQTPRGVGWGVDIAWVEQYARCNA
jgi:hypothetical protein